MEYRLLVDVPTGNKIYCFPIGQAINVLKEIEKNDNDFGWYILLDEYRMMDIIEKSKIFRILVDPEDAESFKEVFDKCQFTCLGTIIEDLGIKPR